MMRKRLGHEVEKAVVAETARKVIEAMTEEDRKQLIKEALIARLDDYRFRGEIDEELLKAEASKFMKVIVREMDIQEKIEASVRAGVDKFIESLGQAVTVDLFSLFIHKGNYGREREYAPIVKAMAGVLGIVLEGR